MQTQASKEWDFPVVLGDVFTSAGAKVPRVKAVIRTDENAPIAAVSDRYRLFTHREVQDTVQPFVDRLGKPESKYFVERSGARLLAEHTFRDVQVSVPGTERKVGDQVALRLSVVNSYNASTSLEVKIGGMVLRCLNGMTIFDSLFDVRFKHLGEDWKLELPDPALVMTAFQKAGETWQTWAYQPVEAEQKALIVDHSRRIQLLPSRYYEQEKARFEQSETVWDLYNAYTYVLTHVSKKVQQSGRLNRYDKLNVLFEHEFGQKKLVA